MDVKQPSQPEHLARALCEQLPGLAPERAIALLEASMLNIVRGLVERKVGRGGARSRVDRRRPSSLLNSLYVSEVPAFVEKYRNGTLRLEDLSPGLLIGTWVKVVRHRLIDHGRRQAVRMRKRRTPLEAIAADIGEDLDHPRQRADSIERQRRLLKAMDELAAVQEDRDAADVLRRVYLNGDTVSKVARDLHTTRKVVERMRLHAMAFIRQRLGDK
jgi:RNA polymerase sigma factor (sigma-70 family)